jgi:hypothetical protein
MIDCLRDKSVLNDNRQAYEKVYYGTLDVLYLILKLKREELEQKIKFLSGIS